ncbi:MAG: PAS domain S-box protein [Candidatus Competibacteraceae bacterium]
MTAAHGGAMPLITLNGLWTGLLGGLIFGLLLWNGIAHLRSRRARLAAQAPAQQALAEIDAYYASAPFGLCRLDTDLRCVRLNAALAKMNRRPVEAPLGKSLREILPHLADDLEGAARQALRTGQPFHDLELSGNTAFPSGQRQRWRISGCPLKNADGQVNGLHLVVQEVTVPCYAEARMTRLFQLVENSAEFIGLARLDRRAWYLNRAGRQLVGLADEAAVRATRIEDYLFPEDRTFAQETVLSTVQREGRWAGEFRFRHFRTGEPIPVWWQIFRLDDPETGQPTCLATVSRDLRTDKAAEHTLRQYQQIVAAFPDSVSLVDRQYRYQFVNAEYRRRTGKPETAIVGHSVAAVLGEAVFQGVIQPRLDRCLQGQTEHYQSWFEFTASGRQFLDVIYSPYRNEQDEITGVVVTARDITPLKQAEEALHQSEQRLTLALSAARAGAWEWNVETNRAVWSEENYRLLGLMPGSVEAHYEQWLTCVHPDDRAKLKQQMDEAVVQGRDLNVECRVVWPDGSLHWVHNVGKMRYDPMGKPAGMYGIQIDITDRKRAEEAWRESESKYRRLHESMRDAFVQVDMAGHIQEFNQTYQEMLGYPEDALRQLMYQELTPEKWHDIEAGIVEQQILTRGYSDIYEKEYRRQDGSIFPVELRGILLRDSAGRPTGMWAIVRDITERKRAEQSLRESERRFATLANSAPVLIWVAGPDGDYEFINQAYATFFGVEETSVRKQNWIGSIHPEDRQVYLDLYQRALAQRAPFETQVRWRRKDGYYRWMKSSGQPRFSVIGDCLGYAGCLLDITELKQAEAALRQADQCKDEFLAMLAHELRNPLAPIRSAVQILNRLGPAEPKQQWARNVIERQVKHLARLVDDLLDSARLVRGQITLQQEPVELAAIVQQAVDAAQPSAILILAMTR